MLVSVGAVTVISSGASLWISLVAYLHGRQESVAGSAQVLAAGVADAAAEQDRKAAQAAIEAIRHMPDLIYAAIELDGGVRLAEWKRVEPESAKAQRLEIGHLFSGKEIRSVTPIMQHGERVGSLVLVMHVADMHDEALSIIVAAALACCAAALFALLVAGRLQRAIVGPVRELAAAVARVRDLQIFEPVEAESDDEIGLLVDGFNAMIEQIRRRDLRIDRQLRTLERQVQRRTAELHDAKEAAEDASRAKSQFLATMSHEIRTPMHGVLVMAELLAGADLPERQRRHAEVIVQSGKNLLALINDLLDLSKIEAGRLELERAPVDVAAVIDQTAALFWERAREKRLDIATFIAPETPRMILGDAVRIGQIVANLVGNALKFTDQGFVFIAAMIDPNRPDRLLISVRDSGIGIAREKLAAVFGEFTQADQTTTRTHGGTGLGLAICRRLARAMGGDVSASSEVGKGSVFVAEILAHTHEEARAWPRTEEPKSVLLDTALPATRRVLVDYFTAAGFEIYPRAGGGVPNVIVADASRLERHRGRADAQRVVLRPVFDAGVDALLDAGAADAALDLPLSRSAVEALIAQIVAGDLRAAAADGALPKRARSSGALYGRARALVVDDNAVNREVAIEALGRFGIRVETAENGRQAVDLALSGGFDIVFMDGSMPEMDGFEATRRIRAAQASPLRTPIIALTADVLGVTAADWRDAGADDVLYKPFTMEALGQVLARFVTPSTQDDKAVEDAAIAHVETLGSSGFVQRVATLYAEQAPQRMLALGEAAKRGDWDEVARMAHAVKSMSLSLGLEAPAKAASEIERRVRMDGVAPPPADIGRLAAIVADYVDRLQRRFRAPEIDPAKEESDLAKSLAAAIDADSLEMHYQPIVDRQGERTLGFEALLRWRRLGALTVSTPSIVACAEQHALAERLGDWTLRRAVRDARALGDAYVSVNVSPTQLRDHAFAMKVKSILAANRVAPERLVLEITEQTTLSGEPRLLDTIAVLRQYGVKIALDDFGTGYSSLTHLRRFPIDKLKLDRSFVADLEHGLEAAAIIHAVVAIGRTLGFEIIAEGVETEGQHAFLRAAGVHAMQGWRFSRAVALDKASLRIAGGDESFKAAG